MNEVRFHARKGQGAIEAARVLAAAFRLAGRDASWLIPAGWEECLNYEAGVAMAEDPRGSGVSGMVVFYEPLLEAPDLWVGFEQPDMLLVNSRSTLQWEDLPEDIGVAVVDASGIAKSVGSYCGLPGLVAPMLGAFAATSGAILGARLVDALREAAASLKMDREEFKKVTYALELGYDSACILRGKRALHCDDPELEKLLFAS